MKGTRTHLLICFCAVILLISAVVNAQRANTKLAGQEVTMNRTITFTGTLKDDGGQPRLGNVGISFALYSSQEGGDSLWRESQTVRTDEQGRYTVLLGAMEQEGLPLELFSEGRARWLGVEVQGEREQPRIMLVAVPYALKAADADTVGGRPLSSFVLYEDLEKVVAKGNTQTVIATEGKSGGLKPDAGNGSFGSPGTGARIGASGGTVGRVYGNEIGSNTWYGENTGVYGAGSANSYFGYSAGYSNSTASASGTYNSFFGYRAGYSSGAANNNSFFGANAGQANLFTSGNSFFGYNSGYSNWSGSGNSFFGDETGYSNTFGSNNSFFGTHAGNSNVSGTNNSFIGAYADGVGGIFNATALGSSAQVTQSNSLVLGSIEGVNFAQADTNVGIGTTAPDRQLVIEGAQALTRMRRFQDGGGLNSTFGPALLMERARGTRNAPGDIGADDHLGKVQFRGRVGGNQIEYGAFSFVASDTNQNGRFAFLDRDITTERVSILNTGNVGIGTTNPTERLHVVGNIRLSGTIISGAPEATFPDYVFDPEYRLMPLDQLKQYLAREMHLPNMPSAREIREKGLNLTEIQMKLLEKIEELTLYTLRQQTAIENKEEEISQLRTRILALEHATERLANQEDRKPK